MTNETTTTETTETTERMKYGFKMEFPSKPFTMKTLMSRGVHPNYHAAYQRVRKALKNNELEVAGEVDPKTKRRGAREVLYRRKDAKVTIVSTAPVSTAEVAMPSVINW